MLPRILLPLRVLAILSVLVLALACEKPKQNPTEAPKPTTEKPKKGRDGVEVNAAQLKNYQPLPAVYASAKNPITEAKVTLGRMLYFDKRMSPNHDISCNSCHNLQTYGVDHKPVSEGHRKQKGTRNSPTVYNAAGLFVQFWDGRSPDVEHQATQPILNPIEHGMKGKEDVAKVLKTVPGYLPLFKAAFPGEADPITLDNVGKAIGAFERKLVTPGRWDKFLKGDRKALSDEEKLGFNAFINAGCMACHMGAQLGGTTYQRLGVTKPWPNQKDQGRFDVTKKPADKMMFRVPGLRNVGETGPYTHDGSIAKLEQVVKMMGTYQLGKKLDDTDVELIVKFLRALSGPLPDKALIAEPKLPPNGPNTPKPMP